MAFCKDCGTQISDNWEYCPKCGVAVALAHPAAKARDFPSVLWLLPVIFAFPGGLIAAFVSSLIYKASWWELFVAGLIVSAVWVLFRSSGCYGWSRFRNC